MHSRGLVFFPFSVSWVLGLGGFISFFSVPNVVSFCYNHFPQGSTRPAPLPPPPPMRSSGCSQ
jgi:hypothetical protein